MEYETCINCGLEVSDPTNPNKDTKYIHLVTFQVECYPDDLLGGMANEQRQGIGYVACPIGPNEEN